MPPTLLSLLNSLCSMICFCCFVYCIYHYHLYVVSIEFLVSFLCCCFFLVFWMSVFITSYVCNIFIKYILCSLCCCYFSWCLVWSASIYVTFFFLIIPQCSPHEFWLAVQGLSRLHSELSRVGGNVEDSVTSPGLVELLRDVLDGLANVQDYAANINEASAKWVPGRRLNQH